MKLLIVDDSSLIRKQLSAMVAEAYPDWEITTAADGQEALIKIADNVPEIMLLDVIMPKIDGLNVLERIRELTAPEKIKVIMITSLTDINTMKQCFELGAKDFISKPINKIELLSRLDSSLKTIRLFNALENSEKKLREQIKQVEEINQKLVATRQQMLQQENMAAIGNLSAGVAHEINNPLGFVVSNFNSLKEYFDEIIDLCETLKEILVSEKLEKQNDNMVEKFRDADLIIEDIPQLFSETKTGLDRVTDIVKSLQSFSRINEINEYHTYDINQGILDTLTITHNKYKYIANVETDLGDIPQIHAHGGRLNQVFMNLIINACDAIKDTNMDAKGNIYITTRKKANNVEIVIADDGKGIDEKKQNEIFTPFFTTKDVGKGIGLGLSISYDIITHEHHGTISVDSKPGQGAKFTVTLPVELD